MITPPRIWIVKSEPLAAKEDGVIVEYGAPVACEYCGRSCTVKVLHMSNGHRLGRECASTVEIVASYAHSAGRPMTVSAAEFFRTNKKQIAYLRALGAIE